MITLFVLFILAVAIVLYFLLSLIIGYGWAIFIIIDIVIAVKVLSWIFGPKKKKAKTDLTC